MAKTVFSNEMTAHVWAQRTQEHGRSSNGQFYFNGPTLYSYRDTWPLAHFLSTGGVVFNSQSYSNTTSKHLSLARRATNYSEKLSISDVHLFSGVIEFDRHRDTSYAETYKTRLDQIAENYIAQSVKTALDNAAARRLARKKHDDINGALADCDNVTAIYAALELPAPDFISIHRASLQGDIADMIKNHGEAIKAAAEAEAKRRADAEAKRAALAKKAVKYWLKGVDTFQDGDKVNHNTRYAMGHSGTVYLRLKGDNVETSQGAQFPIEHAKRAFQFIRKMKDAGVQWPNHDLEQSQPMRSMITLGHFTIDTIDTQGNVKAGCHFVKWPQIERVARELKIFP